MANPELDDRDLRNYGLGLLGEECGELGAEISRGVRFGFDTPSAPGNASWTQMEMIHKEAADAMAAIEWCMRAGVLDADRLDTLCREKLGKLLDPSKRDHLGRPLAPILPPHKRFDI